MRHCRRRPFAKRRNDLGTIPNLTRSASGIATAVIIATFNNFSYECCNRGGMAEGVSKQQPVAPAIDLTTQLGHSHQRSAIRLIVGVVTDRDVFAILPMVNPSVL